jgi:hypothetical protein
MKYLISFLCIFWAFDQAFSEDCPTRKPNGEACIVTQQPSTDVDGNWVTHKLPVSNDCDCQCHADFTTVEGDRLGADVLPHAKDSVICTNVNGKGCTGHRKEFTFSCTRWSNSQDETPHRNFSKDECRDDRCASADYEMTENWKLTNAAKAMCDQQYLQCLKDGPAKPDFDQALRVARTQVTDSPQSQDAIPQESPSEPKLVTDDGLPLVECRRGGWIICLAKTGK